MAAAVVSVGEERVDAVCDRGRAVALEQYLGHGYDGMSVRLGHTKGRFHGHVLFRE